MSVALFPLGVVAVLQTQAVVEKTADLSRSAYIIDTDRAAAQERAVVGRATGAADALEIALQSMRGDLAACTTLLTNFVAEQETITFAAFLPTDRSPDCTSADEGETPPDALKIAQSMVQTGEDFEVDTGAYARDDTVFIINRPVYDRSGLIGVLSLFYPQEFTDNLTAPELLDRGFHFVMVTEDGTVVASSAHDQENAAKLLPAAAPDLPYVFQPGQSFFGTDGSGAERFFVVRRIVPGGLAMIGSWPTTDLVAERMWLSLTTPLAMWFAGIGMAFFGLNRLVVRHVRDLRGAMRRFALGERESAPLRLDKPPSEFKSLEESFNRMVIVLSAAEARNVSDLEEKTALLNEVHHRVKNNLQLIASIMNMHARATSLPETQHLLAQLQRRVRGLAAVYQTMDAVSQTSEIDTADLIQQLINELGPTTRIDGHPVVVDCQISPLPLTQDQMVALSMLLAETLAQATRHMGRPADGPPKLLIRLDRVDQTTAILSIANTKGTQGPENSYGAEGTGISERLIKAFVSQLDGVEIVTEEDDCHIYEVQFPIASGENDTE